MLTTSTIHKFSQEINEKFTFEQSPKIALGVSGGPDSLALAILTKQWLDKIGGSLQCLIVNHNLRPEAKPESLYTAKILEKYHIKHHIIEWEGTKKMSNLQNQAREARRNLLTKWCKTNKYKYLFLAHNQDDVVETFFMRLFRGSGLQGLSSIPHLSTYNNITIVRPLLDFKKTELELFLTKQNIKWIKDPSNHDNKFLRSKIRKLLKSTLLEEIIPYDLMLDRCFTGIESIKRNNNIIEHSKNDIMSNIVSTYPEGYLTIKLDTFLDLPDEIALNILASCLINISGKHCYRPRFASLKILYNKIVLQHNKASTLWNCEIKIRGNLIYIYYESKNNYPNVEIIDQNTIKWDNRFIIKTPHIEKLKIIKFNQNIYSNNKKLLDTKKIKELPKKIIYSLPAIEIEQSLYVPFLTKQRRADINILFQPSIPLAKKIFSY